LKRFERSESRTYSEDARTASEADVLALHGMAALGQERPATLAKSSKSAALSQSILFRPERINERSETFREDVLAKRP
jgi:hypothetical protein